MASRTRKPEKIIEIEYILSSSILPKNEIQNLLIEKRKFLKLEPEPFEQDLYSFKLDDTSWLEIYPDIQELKIHSHSEDASGGQILQYRIVGEEIESRTRECHSDGAGMKTDYAILDFVYIENDQRINFISPKEWKERTCWHGMQNLKIVYRLLKLHHPEYRRILRQKIANNRDMIAIGKQELSKLNIPIYNTDFGFWITDPNNLESELDSEKSKEQQQDIEVTFKDQGIDWYRFWRNKEYEQEILDVLESSHS